MDILKRVYFFTFDVREQAQSPFQPHGLKVEMEFEMPRYIALCGYPTAGKSEVQKIISKLYGFDAVDDSASLRDAGKLLYNLTDWHVTTQEGKATVISVGHHRMTVRKALGELGKFLEASDPFHLPRLAIAKAEISKPNGRFVFASVRRNQPLFFRDTGKALIIEVTRKGTVARNDFDEYDRTCLDLSIENIYDKGDPQGSYARLEARVAEMLDPVLFRENSLALAG
jgi:hypothetical protein